VIIKHSSKRLMVCSRWVHF